ncbi:SEFIR domain-containing protein [Geomonas terrae]|uniref:SEFIR domain-containing protein n=1 Tax=Geomonas terrae TaxID=2562681 RepID=UPI0013A5E404|nr:SEFIR domain-containing protein [Geomonas terrae]
METDTIKTFISYSHDTEDHKRLVLSFANQLRKQGIDCNLDQYVESPELGWIKWMEDELESSRYVLIICSEGYHEKWNNNESCSGRGVKWEGAIISEEIYEQAGRNNKFIPVILGDSNIRFIPKVLRKYTHYDVLSDDRYNKLYRRLTQQPSIAKPKLGKVIPFPAERVSAGFKAQTILHPETSPKSNVKQTSKGNNNVQVGIVAGDFNIKGACNVKVERLPVIGTIGANPLLKQAIVERFNKLGEEREKRHAKNAYTVMYNKFKTDFEIKNNKWTVIWDWPESTANVIIEYLDSKFKNTIAGRITGAIETGTLVPSKGHLYAREKQLLLQIGLDISHPTVKESLERYFGVNSHTKLSRMQHWQWNLYLERYIENLINE